MTRRPPCRAASRLALLVPVVLAVSLAGCGSDGTDQPQDFCDAGEAAFAQMDSISALGADPEAFAEAVTDLHDDLVQIDAPDAIAADWLAFTQVFGDLDDSLQSTDLTDTDAFAQVLNDFADRTESDEITTASDSISTYLTENCEA